MMPKNSFYNDFDKAYTNKRVRDAYRSEFEVDRDRVLHTRAFRRLQSKTQVFIPGEYDFYRTRLTHSLEVAQIGRSICNYLNRKSAEMEECSYYLDPDLVEAACLTHDIGNPPFGHAGEAALNKLMKDYGGFEGNAQSARIINNLIFSDDFNRRGMEPSRGFLDSILKYKLLRNEGWENDTPPPNHFIYDDQETLLQFAFGERYNDFKRLNSKQKNKTKSIECQIMDYADDVANAAADVVDGIKARFITTADIEDFYEIEFEGNEAVKEAKDKLINRIDQGRINVWSGQIIGYFIKACSLENDENFMSELSARYRFKLKVPQEKQDVIRFLKGIAVEMVFRTPKIEQLEYKGRNIIEKLFNTYKGIYIDKTASSNILPPNYVTWIKEAPGAEEKYRIICDYIAGMTDSFIIRIYERLFIPNSGSISDII